MLECLTDIVGVTTSDNACIITGLTTEQKDQLAVSKSGLYLDQLPGGVHMKALPKVDSTKSMYDITTGALRTAAITLENDMIVGLNKEYKKSRNNFVGQVGQMSFSSNLAVTAQFQGMRLRPVDYSDAVITLNRIAIIVDASATFYVYLYRAPYKGTAPELVDSWQVTTTANTYQFITPPTALKLPTVVNGEMMDYFLLWDRIEAGGADPKNNKLICSTCDKSPVKVTDYIRLKGFQTNNFLDLSTGLITDDYAHGLIADISIQCDTQKLFCGNYTADESLAVCMAYAVQFKAGELVIEDVLKSPDISRFTTMDKERLWGKRNHFRKEYEGRIAFLMASIDVTASNCYICRTQQNQPIAGGIFI